MTSPWLHRSAKLVAGLALDLAATSAAASAGSERASGVLNMNASLALASRIGACPAPPGADDCAARTISGRFPGLGAVTGTYEFLVNTGSLPCTATLGKALAYPIRFTVASKGEIHVAVAEGPCVDVESVRTQTQTFTVTGGTGFYAGTSGGGSLARALDQNAVGKETWSGTLTVPDLEFDLTAPTLTGATNRSVRAKKGAKTVRVVFIVAAQDGRDGAVPVTCDSRSGTRFPLGRTRVTCSATDTSANSATASFTINVRKGR